MTGMRRFLRDNGLTLFFAAIFLLALLGQALTGHAEHNNQLMADGADPISCWAREGSFNLANIVLIQPMDFV